MAATTTEGKTPPEKENDIMAMITPHSGGEVAVSGGSTIFYIEIISGLSYFTLSRVCESLVIYIKVRCEVKLSKFGRTFRI